MVHPNESVRDPSTELLRSNSEPIVDRDPDNDSIPNSTAAQQISSWRRVTPALALTIGSVTLASSALFFKFPDSRPTGISDVFDFSCNDKANDPLEQKFDLDLTFGRLTFAQAKSIDIAWDTVIGQGGRMLHGWILYRYVLHPLLVVLIERFTVTSDLYISLHFSRASFERIWNLAIFRRRSVTIFLCTLLVIYALGYTLFFSVVWGAATGYVSISHDFYPMPDTEVIPLNSPHLSLCWVLDDTRLELDSRLVETGPSFANVGGLTKDLTPGKVKDPNETELCFKENKYRNQSLHYTASGWRWDSITTIWDYVALTNETDSIENSSFNFKSIRDYALTAQTLRIAITGHHWQQEAGPQNTTVEAVKNLKQNREAVPASWWANLAGPCRIDSMPFSGAGLASSIELPRYSSDKGSILDTNITFPPFNGTYLDRASWNRFVHNDSSSRDTLRALPYNSTIWLNGTAIHLEAPFLDVGVDCYRPSVFTGLCNCVCYKGNPIPLDYISKKQAICRAVPGAVWGFSTFLTRLGLFLEASWLATCALCDGIFLGFSGMLRKELIWTTSTRRAALAFSRVVQDAKGEGSDQLSEKELASRLKGMRFGYPRQSGPCQDADDDVDVSEIRLMANPPNREDGLTDITNAGVEKASRQMRDTFRKRKPTESEVYEDLNWRLYDSSWGK
ncbi:hypothetical protein PG984_005204 [Apiospora sp. TS-2023a]